ncbi:MAG: hypothetical protein IJ173_03060 [Kiritimatiellae bacterium]|nr:hypothetical protein [Kiritimatiellia bacterium]
MLLAILAPSARAALKYEPNCYAATTNLLLQLDGIRNVGMTKAHDSNAATWVDLAKGNEAIFGNVTGSGITSEWAEDGYVFGGGEYGILAKTINPGNVFTVQIVCDMKPSEQKSSYPSLLGAADDKCNFYTYSTGNKVMFKTANGSNIGLENWGGKYLTAMYDEAGKTSFQTATGSAPAKGSKADSVGAQTFCIGSVHKASDATYATQRYLNGTVKAIRIYNKILSATELNTNRALDEARFFNGIPVTNVVVATAVAGLEGNESGVYAYDENGYTFSAPHKATKDGVDYACTGYTLETWNGESWTKPVFTASTEYAAKDTSAKVRLTWQWQRTSGSKSPDLDPLFDDYVTDGLILHLDGIRNVGKDKAHDYSARQWIDLASGNRVNFGNAGGAGVTSEWADDGYVFGGGEIGRLVDTINPGNAFTIQIVCDVDKTASFQKSSYPHYFGENGDKCNLYTYRADDNNKLVFRVKAVSNVSDASINPWTGRQKYITALYDKGKSSVFSTETGSVTAGTTETAVGARAFTIAGIYTGSASDTARFLNGTIKSVRIYNKVLNAEELAQNRAVDEARFFGAGESEPNVVVASSVRGVSGDTPDGAYVLPDGGCTFTAPASVTVGEDTYSCAGYTLETWDGSAWGTPVSHSGTSVPLTDKSAKVRLTWQWSHTAGPGYDAAFNDYVTDGLIVHLDGIRNTGAQAVHDSNAKTWADLANPGDYARFIIPDADCGWKSDGYYFDGNSSACYAIMNTERTLGAAFTAQAVLDFDYNNSHRINTAWPAIFGTTATDSDYFAMYYNQNNSANPGVCLKVAGTHVRDGGFKSWKGEYVTGLSDGTTAAVFQTETPDATAAFNKAAGTRTFTFCGGNGDGQGYTTRRFNGIGKTARIYNRALTDEELARNRAADEVRFFGRSPAASGDLVVASTVEGLAGNLPCGAYRPVGYTFTAPTEATLGGVPYELNGYTLETWNGSAWADGATVAGGSSVTPDVSSASKRLTWNWVVKSRLTKIKEYDVGDYIQDGLYLFYDGFRNAGATADHDPNATEWVNLGTGGASLNAVFDYASNASAGDGWEADGYHFKYGGKFAKLASDPKIDWKVTIQVVCEAEKSGKTSGDTYPTYFGSTNDYLNVYGFGSVARTFFKIRNNVKDIGSGRFELLPSASWEGKYLTAIWHAGKYQLFQSVTPVENQWDGSWRKWWDQFKDQPFYIGGVYMEGNDTYVDERRLTGKIQAIRVYNRSLSDEELEQNRKVDEARFKGNPPESNVMIATKYGDGTGETLAEEVGNYKVEGTYTFSATLVKDSKDVIKPVKGYYLEKYVNDAWTDKTWHDGQSYTYVAGDKVRVTWSARPSGLVLILR